MALVACLESRSRAEWEWSTQPPPQFCHSSRTGAALSLVLAGREMQHGMLEIGVQELAHRHEEARTFLEQTRVPRLTKPFRAVEVRQLVQQVLQKAGA